MRKLRVSIRRNLIAAAALSVTLLGGCAPTLIPHLIEERSGNVTVLIINNTSARAVMSLGSWDSLDRDPPAVITIQQPRVESRMSSPPITLPCRRNIAIGTDELVQRARDTNVDANAGFNLEAFVPVVNFSNAPNGSTGQDLPSAGTAAGIEVRLGVDFTCGDQLIFTLEDDPNSPGGFRVDFIVLPDIEPDA